MRVWTIAAKSLRRMLRDRSNVFFVFILPMLLIVLIGLAFGGGAGQTIAVSADVEPDGDGERILTALEGAPALEVHLYATEAAVEEAVARGWADAGVIIPAEIDRPVGSGGDVSLGFYARPDGSGPLVRAIVDDAISRERSIIFAARFVASEGIETYDRASELATVVKGELAGVSVRSRTIGEVEGIAANLAAAGRFDLGASQQLILFVFLVTLTGYAALIQTRQLGVARRMLASPTSLTSILLGETLGRFAVAMVQGLYIIIGTLVVFGVDWGDPIGAFALLTVFAFVSAGAAILLGATLSNDAQAGGIAILLGLGLGALGGCMVYLEFFSPAMRRVAFLTPHAWALDGYGELILRGGGVLDVLPQLGVLVGYAVVLTALGVWRLRKALVTS
jgi:ABC-2 type transport system permease protein